MKRKVRNGLLVAVLATSLGFYSCGDKANKSEDKVMDEEIEHDMKSDSLVANSQEAVINVQFKETAITAVFNYYIEVKNALVASDNSAVQMHGKMLKESLVAANAEQSLVDATNQLVEATDIDKQRESFSKITKGMETVLTGAISSGEVYKQFCPMAFDGKGDYWYSSSSEIRNPYFGDKMLKCGRVEEVINNKETN